MAKEACIGDCNNTARESKKMYFGDSDGKARKVKKMYFGDANNKAQLCWSSGFTWAKYSCNVSSTTYYTMYPSDYNWADYTYTAAFNATCASCDSWDFSQSAGFIGRGYLSDKYRNSVGRYMVSNTSVEIITSVVENDDGTITVRRKPIEKAYSTTSHNYSKGSKFYGEVYADDDARPEKGTLVQGSINGSYCIIRVGNTYYYYEKVV